MRAATTAALIALACSVVLAVSSRAETARPGLPATPNLDAARIAEAAKSIDGAPSEMPPADAPPEATSVKNPCWPLPAEAPRAAAVESCNLRPCPHPVSGDSDSAEAIQQQQVKTILVQVILRRLDLQGAVTALNTSGIQAPGDAATWSTVELLDLLIPDDVTDPATFATIVVENFRSKDGWPIAFELGDSRCTVVRRGDSLGEAGYHDLTCEFHQK
ncbi:MAG: hypothetical protein OXC69_00100 [Candidatus Tectomicrobia bacterium]|nr:hypothetical protein [Candidatus Tectomicrobia bacterium]